MKNYKFISDTSGLNQEHLSKQIQEIIKAGWGEFGADYVDDHILNASHFVVAEKGSSIVGFASARKIMLDGEPIYYLEFTAIHPNEQGNRLSKELNKRIFIAIMLESIRSFRLSFDIATITPNPRVLGTIARTASAVYPNPYEANHLSEALDKKIVQLVHNKEVIPEPIPMKLKNYVIEGFYYDCPELVYEPNKVPKDKDRIVNNFAKQKLKYEDKKGREFVIIAHYRITDFLKKV